MTMTNVLDEDLESLSSGQILSRARASKGFTANDIAEKLRLSVSLITLIEKNQFEGFPAPVYLRGYLRSYAKLVDLSENETLYVLSQAGSSDDEGSGPYSVTASPVFTVADGVPKTKSVWKQLLLFVFIMMLVWVTYWLYINRGSKVMPELPLLQPKMSQVGVNGVTVLPLSTVTTPDLHESRRLHVNQRSEHGHALGKNTLLNFSHRAH